MLLFVLLSLPFHRGSPQYSGVIPFLVADKPEGVRKEKGFLSEKREAGFGILKNNANFGNPFMERSGVGSRVKIWAGCLFLDLSE